MSDPTNYTWELAKADTQEMELEIAALVPAELTVAVEQNPRGTLLSCSETEWSWNGATTVTVVEGTEMESLIRRIQAQFDGSRFDSRTDPNIVGKLQLQLTVADTAENYIVVEGIEPTQLRISSGSACFVLPEGMWPGDEF